MTRSIWSSIQSWCSCKSKGNQHSRRIFLLCRRIWSDHLDRTFKNASGLKRSWHNYNCNSHYLDCSHRRWRRWFNCFVLPIAVQTFNFFKLDNITWWINRYKSSWALTYLRSSSWKLLPVLNSSEKQIWKWAFQWHLNNQSQLVPFINVSANCLNNSLLWNLRRNLNSLVKAKRQLWDNNRLWHYDLFKHCFWFHWVLLLQWCHARSPSILQHSYLWAYRICL